MNFNTTKVTANLIKRNSIAKSAICFADKNPTLFNSVVATTAACTIRPIGINMMPTKKEDKKYFTVRSFITGLLDLATSAIYYIPINKIADNIEKNLLEKKDTIFYKDKNATKSIKTLINRGSYFIALPIQSALMFWMIPKIVNKIFPNNKEKDESNRVKFLDLTRRNKK